MGPLCGMPGAVRPDGLPVRNVSEIADAVRAGRPAESMITPSQFTGEEAALMADQHFFRAKAQIMAKVRHLLEATHAALKEEVASASLATPSDFDPTNRQFVKGESLELFPYQYLDFPKHFHDSNTFTFRTLFGGGTTSCAPYYWRGGDQAAQSTDRESVSSARRAGAGTVIGAHVVGMETWRGVYIADHPRSQGADRRRVSRTDLLEDRPLPAVSPIRGFSRVRCRNSAARPFVPSSRSSLLRSLKKLLGQRDRLS